MPAIRADLTIQAGSFERRYWVFHSSDTGEPIDLTTGYTVSGQVSASSTSPATGLLTLGDSDFRRTSDGRIYYEPPATSSASWTFRRGHYQFELHPQSADKDVRFAEGRFLVSPQV